MSYRAQFAVRKRGSVARGSWSTRVLTLDTESGTVTISRRNHPDNVLYHSLKVLAVQMWPHFKPGGVGDHYESLETQMTLRIVGTEVPVPCFSFSDATAANTPSLATLVTDGPATLVDTTQFAFIQGDTKRKSRPLRGDMVDGPYEMWMIRFTSIESYETAVALLQRLRNYDGSVKRVLGDHVAEDLVAVKRAWAGRVAVNNAVTKQLVCKPPKDQLNGAVITKAESI
ncbi:hypothetical protein ABL78_2848 [Leptomonas seymouri]|uniref:Uncharacterized protein n=1 Tax=Leptomonas seymouri TaxID=5684 RepID=A0A0N1I8Q6_LEPSE|nr:hypothetical protein ABL78_2848 [Leptomonas seymouri]|eukprot:KPI88072.1 hypothetical protein ABL78_2848 [Leptomonas seymouri]